MAPMKRSTVWPNPLEISSRASALVAKKLQDSKRQKILFLAYGGDSWQGIHCECGSPRRVARDTGRYVNFVS
jgi:hypothetical protein